LPELTSSVLSPGELPQKKSGQPGAPEAVPDNPSRLEGQLMCLKLSP